MTRRELLQFFSLSATAALFSACSTRDAQRIYNIATAPDPRLAAEQVARGYAQNPSAFFEDAKRFANFVESFQKQSQQKWGKSAPSPKADTYVKYYDKFRSKSLVSFREGYVLVEALNDDGKAKTRLNQAIVYTLLTPADPSSAVSQYDAEAPHMGKEPFLYRQVKDHEGKDIRWEWRAKRFASYLVANKVTQKSIKTDKGYVSVQSVKIPMVADHEAQRQQNYSSYVTRYSAHYKLPRDLVYAIIKTESDFNPNAINSIPAIGLMQIVPKTAGVDAYSHVYDKKWTPSKNYLFDPKNNIELGTAYLNILDTRYLADIRNDKSREHCMIAAYNTGSGNVLKAFSSDRQKAKSIINSMNPESVYSHMRKHLPYEETRNYIYKVKKFRSEFS